VTGEAQTSIVLTMGADRLNSFFLLLQQGFGVPALVPCTVKELLCDQFGMDAGYVAERITTIFLNGKATDDIDKAVAWDGALLALSAAMPGLVGATMRRGGYYAAMRSAITLGKQEKTGTCGDGMVRVKLFNLLLPELGPEFLRRGILLAGTETATFFREQEETFWSGCASVMLNGSPVGPERLRAGTFAGGGPVRLTVIFSKESRELNPT
jgi:hypothetical protein